MFPRRYYAGRMFAQRYFPESQGTVTTVTPTLVFTLPQRSLQFTLPERSLMFTLPKRGP